MPDPLSDIQFALQASIESMQIRSAVEETLRSMVDDVAEAHQLEERCRARLVMGELEERLNAQELALEETRAVSVDKQNRQAELADKFVQELWSLSRELGRLRAVKTEHEALLMQHDEVVAKLVQAEEDLEEARRAQAQPRASVGQAGPAGSASTNEATEPAEPEPAPVSKAPAPATESSTLTAEEKTEPAAVVSIDADEGSEVPNFTELDTPILMNVFGFLDALDILNVAQVNISMYSRVDSLFGLGHGDAEDSSTINSNETPATKPSTAASTTSRSTTTKPSSTAATPAPPMATMVALPPSSAPVAATASTPTRIDGARNLFSSILQPRGSPRSLTSKSASDSGAAPMTAATANSLAAKLSDAELNAIISMTERLKKKEALADKLIKENEALGAKLEGVEAVKDFLIAKVRGMEESMSASQDNEAKVAQQIASDQEVIAFLDGRVQEVECELRRMEQAKMQAEKELERVKEQAEQKSTVMGDMLQFERQRLKENEREWKATKKLLVKEVKSCRSQITALTAERDGYREQNELLRKAVTSPHAHTHGHGTRERFYS